MLGLSPKRGSLRRWSSERMRSVVRFPAEIETLETRLVLALVIGGFDSVRSAEQSMSQGSRFNQLRAEIQNAFPDTTFVSSQTLNSAFLSSIDVLLINSGGNRDGFFVTTPLSGAEQSALLAFVQSGGGALILVDNNSFGGLGSNTNSINQTFISPFGLHVTGILRDAAANDLIPATITAPTHPIANGPFGTVANLLADTPGFFDSLGPNALSLARFTQNNGVALAAIAPATLGPNAGGVVFTSDIGMLDDFRINFVDNRELALNAVAFVAPRQSDLIAKSLSIDSGVVSYSYEISGAGLPADTTVGLYWSADDTFDPGLDSLAFESLRTGDDLKVGIYNASITVADLLASWAQNNGGNDTPPPGTTHLLLVVDADDLIQESDETNNEHDLRPTIGVVTHGQQFSSDLPSWVTQIANTLDQEYEATIPFDWAAESMIPVSGVVSAQGQILANQVTLTTQSLLGDLRFPVQIHMIGHSRGSGLIAQAASHLSLPNHQVRLTFLDPHPAHNHIPPFHSANPSVLGWFAAAGVISFQAAFNDPEISISSNVTEAEVFYQTTPWFGFPPTTFQHLINLWGETPNLPSFVQRYDLTGVGLGHTEVVDYYQTNIVPSIVTASNLFSTSSQITRLSENVFGLSNQQNVISDFDFLFPNFVSDPDLAAFIVSNLTAARTAGESGQVGVASVILSDLSSQIEATDSILPVAKLFFIQNAIVVSEQFKQESSTTNETFFSEELATLFLVGSDSNDHISVQRDPWNHDRLVAKINGKFIRSAGATPLAADVQLIRIEGRGGNDHINLAALKNFNGQILVDGGEGNDHIIGSRGNDVLLGGDGHDLVIGGGGEDVLIGGLGSDLFLGNFGGDLLISGTTAFDDNQAALLGIQAEWTNPNHDYETRVGNLRGETDNPDRLNGDFFLKTSADAATVFDDEAFDLVFGGVGRDWFLFDFPDRALGRRRNERQN